MFIVLLYTVKKFNWWRHCVALIVTKFSTIYLCILLNFCIIVISIDELYTQIGKVNRLRRSWIFCCPVLGFRHCTVLANTWPCPPAQHHCTVVHIACPYLVIVSSILSEDEKAPLPFLIYLQYIIYLLSSVTYSQIHQNFSNTVHCTV